MHVTCHLSKFNPTGCKIIVKASVLCTIQWHGAQTTDVIYNIFCYVHVYMEVGVELGLFGSFGSITLNLSLIRNSSCSMISR